MAKNYIVQFGSTFYTGLSPTFTLFSAVTGGATTPPGITQVPTNSGLYYFAWDMTGATAPIAFILDGATSGLIGTARYIAGSLDPVQEADVRLSYLGTTLIGALGTTASSFGTTLADPGTIYGYLKRLQENFEGNSTFTMSTGVWNVFSRGSSTQLAQKTVTDAGGVISKT